VLSHEKESSVRNAIVQLLAELDTNIVKKEILEKAQSILINSSKYHLETGELYDKRINNKFGIPAPESHEGIARDIATGILELLKKGIKTTNMSNIFCVKCDFSGLDLQGVNFEDAILTWANFSNCNLKGANFDGADLEDTKFIRADLASVFFTYDEDKHPGYRDHYVERQLDVKQYQASVHGPDFTNADLSNADFTGHILFGFSNDSLDGGSVLIFNPSFKSAILTNTKFNSIGIYGTTYNYLDKGDGEENVLPMTTLRGKIGLPIGRHLLDFKWDTIDYTIFHSRIDSFSVVSIDIDYFQRSTYEILYEFKGSNWQDAIWPTAMKEILSNEMENSSITKNKRH